MINGLFVFFFFGGFTLKQLPKAPTTATTGATSSLTPPLEEEPPALLEAEALEPLDFQHLQLIWQNQSQNQSHQHQLEFWNTMAN